MVMVVMVMMMVVTMGSRADADVNASAVVVVMVMMVPDHDLGGPGLTVLRQALIFGFQQGQGVRDRVEKITIAGSLR